MIHLDVQGYLFYSHNSLLTPLGCRAVLADLAWLLPGHLRLHRIVG
jgi:hypothetical protein